MNNHIAIVNYGVGNLGSIANMFKKIGARAVVTSDVEDLRNARGIVLPGVGSFDRGMECLRASHLIPTLHELVVEEGRQLLGICLGMQLLTRSSQEGRDDGLGWLAADTIAFRSSTDTFGERIPHMGWNRVRRVAGETPLLAGFDEDPKFYFLHSYFVRTDTPELAVGVTHYGIDFTSVVSERNIHAVQFHPEKSHRYGMQLLHNFVSLLASA